MTEETLDLFCEHPDCVDVDCADEFAIDMEALAAKYEITVDYLIAEFLLEYHVPVIALAHNISKGTLEVL